MGMGCLGCVTLPVLLALLFAGIVGGGVFYFAKEPVEAVRAQLAEIREGRLDDAYARLSDSYRARLSRGEFAAFVERHRGLKDNGDSSFWSRSIDNDEARLSGSLTPRSGNRERVTFELVREQGSWRVAAIRFEEDDSRL